MGASDQTTVMVRVVSEPPGTDVEEVRQEVLRRWEVDEALFAITRPQVQSDVQRTLRQIYALAYAPQGVVGLVARGRQVAAAATRCRGTARPGMDAGRRPHRAVARDAAERDRGDRGMRAVA